MQARFSFLIRRFGSKALIRWEFDRSLNYPRRFSDFDSFSGPVWDSVNPPTAQFAAWYGELPGRVNRPPTEDI